MPVKRRISKTKKRQQRGGVGYSLDVTKKCKIGGRPEVVATSDCPELGPGDPGFAQALYGGSRRKTKRVKKSKSKKVTRSNLSKNKKTKRVKKSKRGY